MECKAWANVKAMECKAWANVKAMKCKDWANVRAIEKLGLMLKLWNVNWG
jgi:hypothetical protein